MQTIQLYKPYPHQCAVHDAITEYRKNPTPGHIFSINAMRQVGKTTAVGNELLRFACEKPKGESIYISPTFELARKMIAEFSKSLSGTPLLDGINKSERLVSLWNNHTIRCLSAEQGDSIRGLNASGVLVIDELHYIRDSFLESVVAPFTDYHGAPVITISTPRGRRGKHFEYQSAAASGSANITGFDWARYDMSCIQSRTAEWLEGKRATMSERVFRTEILGEFLDNEGTVFPCLYRAVMPAGYVGEKIGLSWGIDWANGSSGDRTVLTAFNKYDEQVYLKEWHSEPPMVQVEQIARILNDHKDVTTSCTAEKNSMGAVYIDALRRATSVALTTFITTNESKRKIVESMIKATEDATVKLMNVEAQIAEFEYFESSITPTGLTTYSAPSQMHDDYVMAACIARSGYGKQVKFIL